LRNFLEKHSSVYKWAARPAADAAEAWHEEANAFAETAHNLSEDLYHARLAAVEEREQLLTVHGEDISQHDKANARLRRVNRFLVTKLREQGVAAAEVPAEKCPGCGSMAAIPENGKHPMGIVRYPDGPKRLFCDGSEE
jgi:hypothetical protein